MQALELTSEQMLVANERRRILAYAKIHRRVKYLRRIYKLEGRKKPPSLRAIAKHCKSCLRTVKAALRLTAGQVILRLRGAFRNTSSRSLKNIKTIGAGPGWAWDMMAKVCQLGAKVCKVDINEIARGIKPHSKHQKRQEDEKYARGFQAEEEYKVRRFMSQPEPKGSRCLTLKGKRRKAFLERETAPGRWRFEKNEMSKQFYHINEKDPVKSPLEGSEILVIDDSAKRFREQFEVQKTAIEQQKIIDGQKGAAMMERIRARRNK